MTDNKIKTMDDASNAVSEIFSDLHNQLEEEGKAIEQLRESISDLIDSENEEKTK